MSILTKLYFYRKVLFCTVLLHLIYNYVNQPETENWTLQFPLFSPKRFHCQASPALVGNFQRFHIQACRSISSLHLLEGEVQRRNSQVFLSSSRWKNEEQCLQVASWVVHIEASEGSSGQELVTQKCYGTSVRGGIRGLSRQNCS